MLPIVINKAAVGRKDLKKQYEIEMPFSFQSLDLGKLKSQNLV